MQSYSETQYLKVGGCKNKYYPVMYTSLWITQTTAQNRKFIFGGLQKARASEMTAKRSIQQQQRRKQLNAP